MQYVSKQIMAQGSELSHYAAIDTIEFASGDNPITTIRLRVGRGVTLKNPIHSNPLDEENNELPVIVGGANASGKTSLLKGINEICKLMQHDVITKEQSKQLWADLRAIGIRHLQIQFAVLIGKTGLGLTMYGPSTNPTNININTRNANHENEALPKQSIDGKLVLENLFQVKMAVDYSQECLQWRDGLRLRRVGKDADEAVVDLYHTYGDLFDTNARSNFRALKSKRTIERFLDSNKQVDISGLSVHDYQILSDSFKSKQIIDFQSSYMISIDRENSIRQIEKLKNLLPEITDSFQQWLESPDDLRSLLIDRMKNNRLFTDLGLTTSDIVYSDREVPGYYTLHHSAPDIIEMIMLKAENSAFYTWYGEHAWKNKQDAIDFIMEGCIHDIVHYVTGQRNTERVIIGDRISNHSYHSELTEVKWSDRKDGDEPIWQSRPLIPYTEPNPLPSISQVLRDIPFLASLLGMKKSDSKSVDILVRFNAFTRIENIRQSYLSSGQKQILALITAVRNAPEGSLILIDEPEISLHVDWQERVVEQLYTPLIGSRLLIATHSPDIVINHRHLCITLRVNDGGEFHR
ncbi:MAG: hypothetical protein CMB55_06380 [Euryarchaeota archaeon]|nr:hypothetical protein [Euryarchaeota archaeon]